MVHNWRLKNRGRLHLNFREGDGPAGAPRPASEDAGGESRTRSSARPRLHATTLLGTLSFPGQSPSAGYISLRYGLACTITPKSMQGLSDRIDHVWFTP